MSIDFAHYAGRIPAYVKHTFLDKYLPALVGRVASKYDEFVYIDGFAGPWKSKAGESFSDTSFGIALNHMSAQKILYAQRGRNVRMRAFLVEKDPQTFEELKRAVVHFPKVECTPLLGEMEDHAAFIKSEIPPAAFSFCLVDPKGFPDIARIMPLIGRNNSEALFNFMFDFANRFAGTTLIPALENWLSADGDQSWKSEVRNLSGSAREDSLEELAVAKLLRAASFKYSPVISVDKAISDRTLYKLIYLTRHPTGLKVFRDSEHSALLAQANARSVAKAEARTAKSGMADMFDGESDIPFDRSSIILKAGEESAKADLLRQLNAAGNCGIYWKDLWPSILNGTVVTQSRLGKIANELRKNGAIDAPHWPSERHSIPKDDQLLRVAG